MSPEAETRPIVVGRLAGVYGVRGWVKVYSYTQPRENILRYDVWRVGRNRAWRRLKLEAGRLHGKGIVAKLEGLDDRDQAAAYRGAEIAVDRSQLAALEAGEYYWSDLIGLQVVTEAGQALGTVSDLMETGANDVLIVAGERERLIPYLPERVVKEVDLDAGRMLVDWDPEF